MVTSAALTHHVFYRKLQRNLSYCSPSLPNGLQSAGLDQWRQHRWAKMIFGHPVKLVEMQSGGATQELCWSWLAANSINNYYFGFPSSRSVFLIPNMYKIAGRCLAFPTMQSLSARALATPSPLNMVLVTMTFMHGVRQDAVRHLLMLCSSSVQEVMVRVTGSSSSFAKLPASIKDVFCITFFDGFRTSHGPLKIEMWDMILRSCLIVNVDKFRAGSRTEQQFFVVSSEPRHLLWAKQLTQQR